MHYLNHFNPRSHKGSDCFVGGNSHTMRRFQPTLPQRERLGRNDDGSINPLISTHAPTKGATRRSFQELQVAYYFNPRSHKGSDCNYTQNYISILFHLYQSFPYIIFPRTARFQLLIIFCTFFLVRIAQGFHVCFHFAPKQYPAFYNACSTDLL